MNVGELIQLFRRQADDADGRQFWSDQELVGYLNEAVQEACERAKLIEDRAEATLTPGQSTCSLDPSVFEVKRVTHAGRRLEESSVEELDRTYGQWESRTGRPRYFLLIQANASQPAQLRFVPTPHEGMVIEATVVRGALTPLSATALDDEPEINARLHTRLLDWVLHRAFMKPDAEVFDAQRSATALAMFEQAFGRRPDANVQRKQRDRRPPIVRSHW